MKGYKAFNKGMICRDKQYAENTIFEEENAEICSSGMHFCKYPLDVLNYYSIIDDNGDFTEFAEVEALGDVKTYDNEKFCTTKLKIGKKINWKDFIKNSIKITKNKIIDKNNNILKGDNTNTVISGDCSKCIVEKKSAIVSGSCSNIIGGEGSIIISDEHSNITGDDEVISISNNQSNIACGVCSRIISGSGSNVIGNNHSVLISGQYSNMVGDYGATLIGDDSSNLVGGDYSKLAGNDWSKLIGGKGSVLIGGYKTVLVGGEESKIKGRKGSLMIFIDRDMYGNVIDFKAEIIDGIKIKEDTFYRLVEGELEEV